MVYIDWYQFKENGSVQWKKDILSEDIVWQDIITGTRFYLNKEHYDSIIEKGLSFIETIKDDIDKVWQYLSNPQLIKKNLEISLFPQLPYIKKKDFTTHRISDHYIIRTGFLYALNSKKYAKEDIRRHGLLCNLGSMDNKKLIDNLISFLKDQTDELDKFLIGEQCNLYSPPINLE